MNKLSVHPDRDSHNDDSEEYEVVSLSSGHGMVSDGGDAAKTFDFDFVTRSLSIDFDKLSVSSASSYDESDDDERRVPNRGEEDCESIQSVKTEEHVAESVGVGRDSESEVAQSVLNSWPPSISPVLNATPHSTTTTTIIPGTEQLFSSLFTSAENKETEGESLLRSFATALVATIFVALHAIVSIFNLIYAETLHTFYIFVPTGPSSQSLPIASHSGIKSPLNSITSIRATISHSIYFGMSLLTAIIAVLYARTGSWSTPSPPVHPILMAPQVVLSTTPLTISMPKTTVIAQHKISMDLFPPAQPTQSVASPTKKFEKARKQLGTKGGCYTESALVFESQQKQTRSCSASKDFSSPTWFNQDMVRVAVNQKPNSAGKDAECPSNSLLSSMSHKDWKRIALIEPHQCITALQCVSRSIKLLSIPSSCSPFIGFVHFQTAWNEFCSAMAELYKPAFFSQYMTYSLRKPTLPIQGKCPANSLISSHSHKDPPGAVQTTFIPLFDGIAAIQKFVQEVEATWNEICSKFTYLTVPSYSNQMNTSARKVSVHATKDSGKCRADSLIPSTSYNVLKNTVLIELPDFSTSIELVHHTLKNVDLYDKARKLANHSSNVVAEFCSSVAEISLPTFIDQHFQPFISWHGKRDKKVSSHEPQVDQAAEGITTTSNNIKKCVDHNPAKPTQLPSLNLADRVSAVAVAITVAAKQVVAYTPTSQHRTQTSKMATETCVIKQEMAKKSTEVSDTSSKAKIFPNIFNEQAYYYIGRRAANLRRWSFSTLQETTVLIETGVLKVLSDQITPPQLESKTCRNKLALSYNFRSHPSSTTCAVFPSSFDWANAKLAETWEEGKRGLKKRGKAVRKGVHAVLEQFRTSWVEGFDRVV